MDPTLIAAAVVTVIAAMVGGTMQVMNAVYAARDRREAALERKALIDKTDAAAQKAEIVATRAEAIAERAKVADEKLNTIQQTTTEAAKNVDGNLSAVRDELTKQTAHSQALQNTVDKLAEIIQAQQTSVNAIDAAVNGTHDSSAGSLKKIDKNTEETARNTERTEATVEALKDTATKKEP